MMIDAEDLWGEVIEGKKIIKGKLSNQQMKTNLFGVSDQDNINGIADSDSSDWDSSDEDEMSEAESEMDYE